MFISANIFQPLIDIFDHIIQFFHNSVGLSWGFSIIALTVVVRLVLLPLTVKQYHNMQSMQKLSPQMKALQARYKDDKQRQQQEIMKLYRENKVNPFSSCLPLVLQLPVFISLFYMLRKDLKYDICGGGGKLAAYALKHHQSIASTPCNDVVPGSAKFGFIPDLTAAATGWVLAVLIVMYVTSQLGSSLLMTSSTMEPTQRYLMLALPFVFVLFVIRFPAGLLVYWITTNVWTIGQQYVIRRKLGPTAPVGDAGGGGGGSSGTNGNGSGPPSPAPAKKEKVPAGAVAAAGPAAAAPRPPPRKKKKRSGRRR
jgi:YidC/Oxa1 family membrane protein insertase